MNFFLITVIAIFFTSCNAIQNKTKDCSYKIADLLNNYDSTRLEINKFGNLTEVFDRVNETSERGIYKFDKNDKLRFYGYLLGANNEYYFGVEYDSLGLEINRPKSNVVRWFVSKYGKDSLKLSFLLYGINNSYGNIRIRGSNFLMKLPLFESKHFTNLIGGDITIAVPQDKTIYLTGFKRNNCIEETIEFKDSVLIPESASLNKVIK